MNIFIFLYIVFLMYFCHKHLFQVFKTKKKLLFYYLKLHIFTLIIEVDGRRLLGRHPLTLSTSIYTAFFITPLKIRLPVAVTQQTSVIIRVSLFLSPRHTLSVAI